MKTVIKTFKAQPIVEDEPVEDAIIRISEPTPSFSELSAQSTVFLAKAEELENALYHSLPGGLYDKLLGVMLRRKSSHFIVSYGDHDDG